jgi:hypothetical protein
VAAVMDGRLELTICSELGLSHSAARILDQVALDSVLSWLPFSLEPDEARNSLHYKVQRPHTLPRARQDLFLEQALAREVLRLAAADQVADPKSRFDLIIGGGGVLANAPDPGQAALVLLDGLQPVGICSLALDRMGLMAAIGAVARTNPMAAAQVVERDMLLQLGAVVVPVGATREGETALICRIEYRDGRALELGVPYGSMEILPLPEGQRATLRIQPTNRFAVGSGGRGRAMATEVEGGAVGVIIDARGRPLPQAKDPGAQQARIQRWLWDIALRTS